MDGWGVSALVAEAERVLVDLARDGIEPITYACLAERLDVIASPPADVRLVAQVLQAMRTSTGRWAWSAQLTAYVVEEATGEPGEAYYLAGLSDPTRVREVVHHRLVTGMYDPDDVLSALIHR